VAGTAAAARARLAPRGARPPAPARRAAPRAAAAALRPPAAADARPPRADPDRAHPAPPPAAVDGIHAVTGNCDYCGQPVDSTSQELNVLGCTFKNCPPLPYHQDCVEKVRRGGPGERPRARGGRGGASGLRGGRACRRRGSSGRGRGRSRRAALTPRRRGAPAPPQFLKSNKLERNRKTGFKCPRGCGKGTTFKEPCPGKIDKSHPIHPRNEDSKKKKKV
jgi:hypothetical protein